MSEGTNENEGSTNLAGPVTKEELIDLVRAIKFAKPDASMRQVHREISETLSQNTSYEFLQNVTLNDVKKVWKKASSAPAPVVTAAGRTTTTLRHHEEKNLLPGNDTVWKLYTVGDGSVKTLAQEYSQATAKAIAEQELHAQEAEQALMENYVHVFLDVPADRSGQRPHQALINFNENKAGDDKSKQSTTGSNSSSSTTSPDERGIICKIQVAASPDGTKYPMLLYNQDRTMKTFIHPDTEDYDRIFRWITNEGGAGALGVTGGTKAYFYCKPTVRKHGPGILSINIRELASTQSW